MRISHARTHARRPSNAACGTGAMRIESSRTIPVAYLLLPASPHDGCVRGRGHGHTGIHRHWRAHGRGSQRYRRPHVVVAPLSPPPPPSPAGPSSRRCCGRSGTTWRMSRSTCKTSRTRRSASTPTSSPSTAPRVPRRTPWSSSFSRKSTRPYVRARSFPPTNPPDCWHARV
jgi:hypothetical protein